MSFEWRRNRTAALKPITATAIINSKPLLQPLKYNWLIAARTQSSPRGETTQHQRRPYFRFLHSAAHSIYSIGIWLLCNLFDRIWSPSSSSSVSFISQCVPFEWYSVTESSADAIMSALRAYTYHIADCSRLTHFNWIVFGEFICRVDYAVQTTNREKRANRIGVCCSPATAHSLCNVNGGADMMEY